MIKEYVDKIREEIKSLEVEVFQLMDVLWDREYDHRRVSDQIKTTEGKIDGLNKALDIYLDLVKEDL